MIVELVRCSDRTLELKEGSRCPILHSLEAAGLVTEQKKATESGWMRQYYRITKKELKTPSEKKAEGAFFAEKIYAVICSCV